MHILIDQNNINTGILIEKMSGELIVSSESNNAKKATKIATTLRTVNAACEPLADYFKFQSELKPHTRIMLDANQYIMSIQTLKACLRIYLEIEYAEIENPSENLRTLMSKTKNNVDGVCTSMTASMKEIIALGEKLIRLEADIPTPTPTNVAQNHTSDSFKGLMTLAEELLRQRTIVPPATPNPVPPPLPAAGN